MELELTLNSRVKFSRNWLRSINAFTGALPFARGKIIEFKMLGDLKLARIVWDENSEELPEKVNVNNLVLENKVEFA